MGHGVQRNFNFLPTVLGAVQSESGTRILHPRGIFLLPDDTLFHLCSGRYFNHFIDNAVSGKAVTIVNDSSVNISDITKTPRRRMRR